MVRGLTSQSDCGTTIARIDKALGAGRPGDAARALVDGPTLPALQVVALSRQILTALGPDDHAVRADVGQRLALALIALERLDESVVAQERTLVDAQEAGDPWRTVVAEGTAALIAQRLGAEADARTLLSNATAHALEAGPAAIGFVLGMRGMGYLEEGEPEVAAALLREAVALGSDLPPNLRGWAQALLAQADALAGRPHEAAAEIEDVLASETVASERNLLAMCLEVGAAVGADARPGDAARIIRTADEIRFETGRPRRPHEVHLVAAVPRTTTDGGALDPAQAAVTARALVACVASSDTGRRSGFH